MDGSNFCQDQVLFMCAGMASKDLALAAKHCQKCSQHSGRLQAVWKLMGDVHLQFHAATPPAQVFLINCWT